MVGRDLQEIDGVAMAEQLGEERLAEPESDPEHRQVAVHGLSLRSRHSRPPHPPPPHRPRRRIRPRRPTSSPAPAAARRTLLEHRGQVRQRRVGQRGDPEDAHQQQTVRIRRGVLRLAPGAGSPAIISVEFCRRRMDLVLQSLIGEFQSLEIGLAQVAEAREEPAGGRE